MKTLNRGASHLNPSSAPYRSSDFIKAESLLDEFAGAFGDLGTLIPLIIGMAMFSNVNIVAAIFIFGLAYVVSGMVFKAPVPVQPMKAIAAITIAGGVGFNIIRGAGLAIGILFIMASFSGMVDWVKRVVPRCVVTGIQMGLGLVLLLKAIQLARLETLSVSFPFLNWVIFLGCILITLTLFKYNKFPAMFGVLSIGLSLNFTLYTRAVPLIPRLSFPLAPSIPAFNDLFIGLLFLAIPQIPLTLGNSVLAIESLANQYFPGNKMIKARTISFSVGVMNIFSALLGGVPMCHGAGGLAGHYRFGARSGFATVFLGVLLLTLSLIYRDQLLFIIRLMPSPVLGAILLFAAIELFRIVKKFHFTSNSELMTTILIAVICAVIPYGFALGLILGVIIAQTQRKKSDYSF